MAKLMEQLQRTGVADQKQTKSGMRTTASATVFRREAFSGGESRPAETGSWGQGEAQEAPMDDTFAESRTRPGQGSQAAGRRFAIRIATGRPVAAANGSPQNQQQQGAGSQSGGSASGSSMVNKMKDSLANLLSALKPPSGGAAGSRR